jgi:hypothetical protein
MRRYTARTDYYEVKVRGARHQRRALIGQVEATEVRAHGPKLLAVLAGALAEEIAERFHDTIEPSAAARAAVAAYEELKLENPHVYGSDDAQPTVNDARKARLARGH